MIIQETELDPKHQALWKRALVSAERKNWDYVVDQMLPVVTANPGFLDGRKLLRSAEEEIAGNMGRRGFGLPMGLFKSASKRPPLEQLTDMEQKVFPKDPFSPGANEQMFDISKNIEFPELGAFALETIRRGHPEDTRNMHRLARHYMDCGQPGKAGEIYAAVLQVDPRDMDALKGEKDAAALASMQRNWEGKTFAETIKSPDDADDSEDRNRQGMTRQQMEQRLVRLVARYESDKTDISTVKQLAETYEKLGQAETALMFFDYALSLNPGDVALQRDVEKIRDRLQEEKSPPSSTRLRPPQTHQMQGPSVPAWPKSVGSRRMRPSALPEPAWTATPQTRRFVTNWARPATMPVSSSRPSPSSSRPDPTRTRAARPSSCSADASLGEK